MERQTLIIPANIDAQTFQRFALFDTFRLQKRWRAPALFAAILSVSAAVCLAMQQSRRGAALLAVVLLAVGLGLPAAYILSFWLSVRRQSKLLDGARTFYTLHLREEGILALTGQNRAEYRWEQVYRVYRVRGCIYLYVSPRQAYLLPEGERSEAAWVRLREELPGDRIRDFR